MPSLIAPKSSGSSFTPAPEGTHVARCVAMIDLGTHLTTGQYGEKRQRKLRLSFELPGETAVFNEEKGEQPYVVSREFTFSMHEKAALRGFLEAWRGKKFSDEEAGDFDVSNLLKQPAMLNIMHATSKDRTYANVGAASRLPKGMTCPPQITPTTIFSLTEFDQNTFDNLPEWMRTKIADSDEYKDRSNPKNEDEDDDSSDIPF